MAQIPLKADWIVQHKLSMPWACLSGATIVKSDGKTMVVLRVQTRKWPLGPLITIRPVDEKKGGATETYNITGFESGHLREVLTADSQTETIQSYLSGIETERQSKLQAAALLNASRQFDLLLFDLDDTLVSSSHLERFRGKENVDNKARAYIEELIGEVRSLACLISEKTLLGIRASFPDMC